MKIGLINAIPLHRLPVTHAYFQTLSLPLGLLYVGTYLMEQMPGVQVLIKDNADELIEAGIDVLGIYSVTQNFDYAREIAREAKGRGIVTVIGGPHVTALPHRLDPEFDFGVVGEGEETFHELVSHLDRGCPIQDERWKKVPGIVYHNRHSGAFFTGRRHEKKNLDDYPIPRRELWARQLGTAHIITSRGCPFSCSFCSEPVLWDAYRMHSPAYVVREIQDILSHFPIRHILIFDDIFTISQQRLSAMADLFEKEGIPGRLSFSCWGRTHLINEAMVEHLLRMNFNFIAFGIESASQRILSQLKKGATVESHQKAIDLCHRAGLKLACTFIIASPGETVDDLKMTYDFIRKNQDKMSGIEINPAVPLPGTPLWQHAMSRGLVSEDMNWEKLSDWSVFEEFTLDRYVVMNENFFKPDFQDMFKRMYDLYREIIDKGEIAEHTLNYVNPTMEPARLL